MSGDRSGVAPSPHNRSNGRLWRDRLRTLAGFLAITTVFAIMLFTIVSGRNPEYAAGYIEMLLKIAFLFLGGDIIIDHRQQIATLLVELLSGYDTQQYDRDQPPDPPPSDREFDQPAPEDDSNATEKPKPEFTPGHSPEFWRWYYEVHNARSKPDADAETETDTEGDATDDSNPK